MQLNRSRVQNHTAFIALKTSTRTENSIPPGLDNTLKMSFDLGTSRWKSDTCIKVFWRHHSIKFYVLTSISSNQILYLPHLLISIGSCSLWRYLHYLPAVPGGACAQFAQEIAEMLLSNRTACAECVWFYIIILSNSNWKSRAAKNAWKSQQTDKLMNDNNCKLPALGQPHAHRQRKPLFRMIKFIVWLGPKFWFTIAILKRKFKLWIFVNSMLRS